MVFVALFLWLLALTASCMIFCIAGGTAGVRGAVVLRERAGGAGGVSWDGADGLHPRGPLPRLVTDQHADQLAGPAL